MDIRVITPEFSAAPQIEATDLPAIADAGYKTLICNRPDGEAPDQTGSDEMAAAAKAAGLTFHLVPFAGMISPETQAAFDAVMDSAEGPVLAYCRSGTRSTTIWALSMARSTESDALISAAAGGGYDLAPMKPMMDARRG
ncbi:hypothetical protein ACMU_13370 [Actibacterium mucosum KCTC 23349]|uniref:Beta-lactamase hydrolase-like protein phosphatase-like domain-containing protein n=1 Tax=Actibacterium mucosum KCTC 23349 TaxID=1454373 RepID=A0A037ZHR2_9RHOB|nr:TIGR01244 family sulfur transferase [Actibacterium mucosum]KAJ55673.1 hypothetical protein ACMU_13370 [Actibacterium mucosum KCTC 23349]